ncbi:hypothetical protein Molly5_195 [Maribacter phage Molly_5]|uniref:Uncharacterized protein n=2 Tax=Mollyvirus TaxID=2948826 RepID=A0A8E4XXU8_9CAUD|nr:hypothetical protein M1M29_gp195 [Maribacter phage Molly_1]YP_010357437.1 hypothetical protein M1M30_gp188 [Maribacter phage Colly_1]QQO97694.1 hypothetical protein Molly2_195 [Maribacter phage Molly_2]QQO97894.1 hypothetical protein Molly3_195 [Maribacter phage Molly_3]QQO98094.1 hypothetical protein Molly4_195 [Maribacter phage Molly_4]QQO98294.1 hypothetical protein Molly5_195 [Maribacter phage Molly_5]QQO97293.1 hypothetical protein Colly1_188 [Maribacter phage Colly_1]
MSNTSITSSPESPSTWKWLEYLNLPTSEVEGWYDIALVKSKDWNADPVSEFELPRYKSGAPLDIFLYKFAIVFHQALLKKDFVECIRIIEKDIIPQVEYLKTRKTK